MPANRASTPSGDPGQRGKVRLGDDRHVRNGEAGSPVPGWTQGLTVAVELGCPWSTAGRPRARLRLRAGAGAHPASKRLALCWVSGSAGGDIRQRQSPAPGGPAVHPFPYSRIAVFKCRMRDPSHGRTLSQWGHHLHRPGPARTVTGSEQLAKGTASRVLQEDSSLGLRTRPPGAQPWRPGGGGPQGRHGGQSGRRGPGREEEGGGHLEATWTPRAA